MIRVGLIGGRGYVGQELLGLLLHCNEYEVTFVGSSSQAGQRVSDQCEDLPANDLVYEDIKNYTRFEDAVDVWVLAQPNGCASEIVDLMRPTNRIIDISSDYRFDDTWVYGLAERHAKAISNANRVSNPGCYATGAQLALLPILDLIEDVPSVFGVSGYSGAGKKPNDRNQADRLANNLMPYQLADHTHEKEISHQIGMPVSFMPHVGPFFRGISLTISLRLHAPHDRESIQAVYDRHYTESEVVQVQEQVPEIRDVASTNRCLIGGFTVSQSDPNHVVVVSALDNLRKGAASQVMQNLNLMFSLDDMTGLRKGVVS